MRPAPSLKIVSAGPPVEPPTPLPTGRTIALTDPQRHAWSALDATFQRLRPTFNGIGATDTRLVKAPADLDALIAHAQALRGTL